MKCLICRDPYDLEARRPKILKCGHTFCLDCLTNVYKASGRVECSLDRGVFYEDLRYVPDNQTLKDILLSREVRCPKHSDVKVTMYCLQHWTEICTQCRHDERKCSIKTIAADATEITNRIQTRIAELLSSISVADLPKTLTSKLEGRFNCDLSGLIKLLHQVEGVQALTCSYCGQVANQLLDLQSMRAFCASCVTEDPPECFVFIANQPLFDIAERMLQALPSLLKMHDFYAVSLVLLQALKRQIRSSPKVLQEECLKLEKLRGRYDLLEEFVCPACLERRDQQQTPFMIKLPCSQALHVICEICAQRMPENTVVCPLDGRRYSISVSQLDKLSLPRPRKLLKSPPSTTVPPPPTQGLECLVRFEAVLPEFGTQPSHQYGNNKGWFVSFLRNQVEVFTFVAASPVQLQGLTLTTPLVQAEVVLVNYITIHQGPNVQYPIVFTHSCGEQLVGGNTVCMDIFFQTPFYVAACTEYTLKVKLGPNPYAPQNSTVLYRGSPYKRPEIWLGSDGILWDFKESVDVEPSEFNSGQGNLSGPVLRFYYFREQ